MPSSAPAAAPAAADAEAPVEEKPKEKTIFTVKLEKFDATAKAKIIREVKAMMPNMNLVEVSLAWLPSLLWGSGFGLKFRSGCLDMKFARHTPPSCNKTNCVRA
jgi:hypothetical protein